MDYETLLMKELSRRNMDYVAHCISGDQEKFDGLMQLVLHAKEPVVQRAAWAMDACLAKYPDFLLPYLETLIDFLPSVANDGVKRQIVKALSMYEIPVSHEGQITDLCFLWLQSSLIPVAVKVHCMQILAGMTSRYPELSVELQSVIREQIPRNSVGFSSRGKKILQQLAKYDVF